MTELYLIAHKVRGERAFDVAEHMQCPECEGTGRCFVPGTQNWEIGTCTECDGLGFWWIIPTSGHRAYPYWSHELEDLCDDKGRSAITSGPIPEDLPDHYLHGPAPRVDIRALFKKSGWVPAPEAFIPRRL